MTEQSSSHVEQQIAARIARVRADEERKRAERTKFAAARTAGLARRHAAKLRHLSQNSEEPAMPAALRPALCPSCRQQRATRLMTTINLGGAPHDVVKCSHRPCELMWLVRAERPRTVPAAA
ncbi:hypothetical protein ABZU94_07275 [Streptomyces mirabilis]|uniref:hypothetical protein n=1 Tax=Streptomyces sp. NPDC005388 TaxID=3156717 RepID=UPI0033A8A764